MIALAIVFIVGVICGAGAVAGWALFVTDRESPPDRSVAPIIKRRGA